MMVVLINRKRHVLSSSSPSHSPDPPFSSSLQQQEEDYAELESDRDEIERPVEEGEILLLMMCLPLLTILLLLFQRAVGLVFQDHCKCMSVRMVVIKSTHLQSVAHQSS